MDDRVDELSIYLVPGRVTDPGRALKEAEDAERLGFGRVWISERPDLKEAAVLCGAVAARTSQIGVATGLTIAAMRHPLMSAAFGATMQASFGDRFTMGITRGVGSWLKGLGLSATSPDELEGYVQNLRKLWAGETVPYNGGQLQFVDKLPEKPPNLVWGTFGNSRAVEIAGRSFDGVALIPFFTVEAVARTVRNMRQSAERNGRDPRSIRVIHCLVVAPDLEEEEELAVVNGRAVTYFQMPGYGDEIAKKNGWDMGPIHELRNQARLSKSPGGVADLAYHRKELIDVGRQLPREWITEGAAVGSPRDCCNKMKEFFDAGVDEIWIHGSSPAQNADVIDLWRREYRGTIG